MSFYTTLVYMSTYIGLFVMSFYLLSLRSYSKKKQLYNYDNKLTVSLLIPAWNEETSIVRTIQSVLNLNYPKDKFEIIVIDDGSTDRTYELAKKFESNKGVRVRVFKKPNGGKGSALNLGIRKSQSDIVISMDADTFVDPEALRLMVSRFYSKEVMAVTPAMGICKPKNIWQRIQQIEYYLGTFLRKVFATINSIHVTPGAFSAYRREFFLKHGGYDENNITEDLEVALRLQRHGYILENVPEAIIHTIAPRTFKELLIQRRRWYTGQISNFLNYKDLFGPKTGVLGTIVLPMALISVVFSIILTSYAIFKIFNNLRQELFFMNSVNFQFNGFFEISSYLTSEFIQRFFYKTFSEPIILLGLIFFGLTVFYLIFAKRKMKFKGFLIFNLLLFLVGFAILRAFWWSVSIVYSLLNKKVSWR